MGECHAARRVRRVSVPAARPVTNARRKRRGEHGRSGGRDAPDDGSTGPASRKNVHVRLPACGGRAVQRRPAALAALAALFLLAGCADEPSTPPPAAEAPQRLPTATIRVGDVPLVVEVADTQAERQRGMMFRRRLGPDEAMLFVFEGESNLRFWMKNTYVDLDLAYLSADGTILEIARLHAHNTEYVYSREPARFALETPAGWLTAHGIEEGDRVTIPPEVANVR